jgi:hypothetical protein
MAAAGQQAAAAAFANQLHDALKAWYWGRVAVFPYLLMASM